MASSKIPELILEALEKGAAGEGLDIVAVEMVGPTKNPIVRVRIDHADGEKINLDEVASHTKWVSGVIDNLNPISGSYTLEVSSPGADRPLRRPSDFIRFIGSDVEITLEAYEGRKRWDGELTAADEKEITILTEDEGEQVFSYENIRSAKLNPEFVF